MSGENSAWNNIMRYGFLHVFGKDATVDANELAMLERLALGDGVVDDNERRILSKLFSRVSADTVSSEIWGEITRIKKQHAIP